MLIDENVRSEATNPHQSFIVQAPAGSGKTELLTQRFLRLLPTVNYPEQIIALTFTKKAAGEMQERIIKALHFAAQGVAPTTAHGLTTYHYARAALKKDKEAKWDLLASPHRLKIMTIDALCQFILRTIVENRVNHKSILNYPSDRYIEAVRQTLDYAEKTPKHVSALKTLLLHCDNRRDDVVSLMSDLLSKRNLWLGELYAARQSNRAWLEACLSHIEDHTIDNWKATLSPYEAAELIALLRSLGEVQEDSQSERTMLSDLQDWSSIDRTHAKIIANTLLTQQNALRGGFDHHVGLKKGNVEPQRYTALKEGSKSLFTRLKENEAFISQLIQIRHLPPTFYQEDDWQTLEALFEILPLAVAHLHYLFMQDGAVDFNYISTHAIDALGEDDNPTDLALYLDYSLSHLLIDEFQDTSIEQFRLLTRLTRGFSKDDGRTLFLVGDPMQSIYRFRQAEVGLFMKVQQNGLGDVVLKSLELQSNFRSNQSIVNWVNTTFASIFPQSGDIESGAVSFHASHPVHQQGSPSDIIAHQFENKEEEALGIVRYINERLEQNPDESIAILVRSRTHLFALLNALNEASIPYQGVALSSLNQMMHIQDLWTLTECLLYPSHRLSWLSLMRSPFIGLSLQDIQTLSTLSTQKSFVASLEETYLSLALSDDARERLAHFVPILKHAEQQRASFGLAEWIMTTFKHLGGPLLFDENQLQDAEVYFNLLDEFDEGGLLVKVESFKAALKGLYANATQTAQIQIMTIHKSKGLEFDTVILPSLSSKGANADQPMLRWLNFTTPKQDGLLLSPLKASHEERAPIYDYIGRVEAQKSYYELQRLFYVAATRAKKRLYLTDYQEKAPKTSLRGLLGHQSFEPIAPTKPLITDHNSTSSIPRLYTTQLSHLLPHAPLTTTAITPTLALSNTAQLTGTLTHEILEWLCTTHRPLQDYPKEALIRALEAHGLESAQSNVVYHEIWEALERFTRCEIGQWIMDKHEEEHNEYPLVSFNDGDITTNIIDRTFVENGYRVIIDFKTGGKSNAFEAHKAQLLKYQSLFKAFEARPVRCGLYYLATNEWVEIDAQ